MEGVRSRLNGLLSSDQFSYPELRKMFFTLVLDQFFIFFIGMLSTALVSSVGEAAMSAVSLVGTINGMVSLVFTSLATGGAIVVARAKGGGDQQEIRRAIGEVTGLCGVVSLALSGLLFIGAPTLVHTIYGRVEPLVARYAVQYMRLVSVSFVPYSIFNAIFNIFRNLGDTKSSLLLTIVINVAHLLLSLLFINGLGLGVEGSGYSYIAARSLGMGLALLWLLRVHNTYHVGVRHFFHFNPHVTKEIVALGMPLTVESLLMQGGMLLVQTYLTHLPTAYLAAHAVANSLMNLYHSTSGALSSLTGTVCGQCYGAGHYDLTRRYCKNIIRVGRWVLLATALILYPLTPLLLKLYKASAQGEAMIYTALSIGAAGLPLLWCDGYIPAMAMRVAGDSQFVGAVSVVSLLLGRCALGYVLTIPAGLGVPGIWIGMVFEWLIRGIALHVRFRGKRWMHAAQTE